MQELNRPKGRGIRPPSNKLFFRVFFIFFVTAVLGALENWDSRMAGLYYDRDDYGRAYGLYEDLVLRQETAGEKDFGDILYRYGYCYEQIRGFDNTVLNIYALSLYYNEREGTGSKYTLYAGTRLARLGFSRNLDGETAASALTELRDSITKERKAPLYGGADRIYSFFSRFSIFQWKIIVSLIMLIPFFTGILILGLRERKSRP
jgi:hypothetical protein